jgi:hypothetical protein
LNYRLNFRKWVLYYCVNYAVIAKTQASDISKEGLKNTERMENITVIMTVKSADKGLNRRLESILCQLNADDEVLIPANPADLCNEALCSAAGRDSRIKIIGMQGADMLETLQAMLRQAAGRYIFLAESCDTWHPGKRAACVSALEKPDVMAVVHDAVVVDGDLNEIESTLLRHRFRAGLLRNLFCNRFYGCCMVLRKDILKIALPFPPHIRLPGRWLGIAAGKIGRVVFLDRTLTFYCRRRTEGLETQKEYGVGSMRCAIREAVSLCFELSCRASRLQKEKQK